MVIVPPVLRRPLAMSGTAELESMAPSVAQVSLMVALDDSPGSTTFAIRLTAMRLPLTGSARQAGLGRLLSMRQSSARTVVSAGNAAVPPTPTPGVSSFTASGISC